MALVTTPKPGPNDDISVMRRLASRVMNKVRGHAHNPKTLALIYAALNTGYLEGYARGFREGRGK